MLQMQECSCNNSRIIKVMEVFKVSSHLTILKCGKCGGSIGEWIDKVSLPKGSYDKDTRQLLR